MNDLVTWLREQIAADVARTRSGRPFNDGKVFDQDGYWVEPNGDAWHTSMCGWRVGEGMDRDCECGVPTDVLAHCEAHTAILDLHLRVRSRLTAAPEPDWCGECSDDAAVCFPCPTIRALGLAYQPRPGYRPEWQL